MGDAWSGICRTNVQCLSITCNGDFCINSYPLNFTARWLNNNWCFCGVCTSMRYMTYDSNKRLKPLNYNCDDSSVTRETWLTLDLLLSQFSQTSKLFFLTLKTLY